MKNVDVQEKGIQRRLFDRIAHKTQSKCEQLTPQKPQMKSIQHTRKEPLGGSRHEIDYILLCNTFRNKIMNCKAHPGV